MNLEIIGNTQDLRTNSHIIYGKITIENYLELIGDNYDEYGIQRKREKHKAYARMKQDIIDGALLPTITLAVNQNIVREVVKLIEAKDQEALILKLKEPGNYSILDGLQRTNILKDIKKEGHEFKDGQSLLLEFWAEPEIKHLIYRLIVLNAGQKPMTMRHQLELLFMSLDDLIKREIPGIDFFKETDQRRRSQPKQYQFDRLVTSYQCYLMKTPELKKDNIVAQQLLENSILDSSEEELNNNFSEFIYYLKLFVEMDELSHAKYSEQVDGTRKANWIASENVMNTFFSAIADFSIDEKRKKRIESALKSLIEKFKSSDKDPLALNTYNSVLKGFETSKVNVGVATRDLLFNGLKEFFREEGDKLIADCWISEAR